MPFVIGMDVGLVAIKGVILEDNHNIAQVIKETGVKPALAAKACYDELLTKANLSHGEIKGFGVTGWGAKRVSLGPDLSGPDLKIKSEVVCLAKGAIWALPTSRTVVDIGAQIVKVARFSENAKVKRFDQSDKCAAGAGRFLDIMSTALELDVARLGKIGASASKMVEISSQCSVFGESEIVSYLNTGEKIEDIANGINYSIAKRVSTIVMRLGLEEDIIVTGGVAQNPEVIRYLENMLGTEFKRYNANPQVIGAIGAALFAQEIL
ncbi:MAG: hypothetical protein JJV92_04350 [Desulfosarcina sp.]|nr:hypothetical protein [Desulfobacterales bacterium]